MPVWLVKSTWLADEGEASEKWEVNAGSAQDAISEVTPHLRFQPHHLEASLVRTDEEDSAGRLPPGEPKRIDD
jgi:hypothetical protein